MSKETENIKIYLAKEEKSYSEGLAIYAKSPLKNEMRFFSLSKRQSPEKLEAELLRNLERLEYEESKLPASPPPSEKPKAEDKPTPKPKTSTDTKPAIKLPQNEEEALNEVASVLAEIAKLSNALADAKGNEARKEIIAKMQELEDSLEERKQAAEALPKLPDAVQVLRDIQNTRSRISKLKAKIKKKSTGELQSTLAKEEAQLSLLEITLEGLKQ